MTQHDEVHPVPAEGVRATAPEDVPAWLQIRAGHELAELVDVVRFAPGQPTGFLHSRFDAEQLLWRWALKWFAPKEPAGVSSLPRPEGWQPISTAPKDGTPILAYQPGGTYGNGVQYPESVGIAYWREADSLNPAMWSGPYNPRDYPTHWMRMPLPPIPEE